MGQPRNQLFEAQGYLLLAYSADAIDGGYTLREHCIRNELGQFR